MKLTVRPTHDFVEIKVDEIETTIFKNHGKNEAEELVTNLLGVIDALTAITGKSVSQHVTENFQ